MVSPTTAFSLIVLGEAVAITLVSIALLNRAHGGQLLEHGKVFVAFFAYFLIFIGLRQFLDIPLNGLILGIAVVLEELLKGFGSRKSKLSGTSVGMMFAAAELAATKANLLLPTAGYLDGVTGENYISEALLMLPAAGLHIATGVIYQLLKRKPLPMAIGLCVALHLSFNIFAPLVLA